MSGLDRSIDEHRLPINLGISHLNKIQGDLIQTFLMILRRRLKDYWKQNLFDHADMQSGYRV
jgi:hypothetical protein